MNPKKLPGSPQEWLSHAKSDLRLAHLIILFGSHARGTGGSDSDADILVVMPVQGSKRKKATEIDLALVGIDLPVDIVVITPDEFERSKDLIGTIIYPAVREGKVLYERAA